MRQLEQSTNKQTYILGIDCTINNETKVSSDQV